jgi:tRNA pseudouridine13 synthase
MRLRYRYWTRSKGIKGTIRKEDDFIVREIINPKFLKRFRRTAKGISPMHGKYCIFLLKKKGMTTLEAIARLSRELGLPRENFGYAGLKDRFSVSYQYITLKSSAMNPIKIKDLEICNIRRTDKPIYIGDLVGNEFTITLHCRKDPSDVIEELKRRGMPNYFGLQRFGSNKNNQIIGSLIIKREFEKALRLINKNCRAKYADISEVPKRILKFFMHSYQSLIFNETLNKYMEKNNTAYFSKVPIVGYGTKLKRNNVENIIRGIIKKEHIEPEDFMIRELKLSCMGSKRQLFIKIVNVEYEIEKNLELKFTLPRGSYATVLLREVCK